MTTKELNKSVEIINTKIDDINIEQIIDNDSVVIGMVQEIEKYQKMVNQLIINDSISQIKATEMRSYLKNLIKTLDESKKNYNEPFQKIVKNANNRFNIIKERIEVMLDKNNEFSLDYKLLKYQVELEAIKKKEQDEYDRKIKEAAEKNKPLEPPRFTEVKQNIKVEGQRAIPIKEYWNGHIKNQSEFMEWCIKENRLNIWTIGISDIKALAKDFGIRGLTIPGFEIFKEKGF